MSWLSHDTESGVMVLTLYRQSWHGSQIKQTIMTWFSCYTHNHGSHVIQTMMSWFSCDTNSVVNLSWFSAYTGNVIVLM